jgi:cyclophilin family peptidyl-prolyl cis-trans isomerase
VGFELMAVDSFCSEMASATDLYSKSSALRNLPVQEMEIDSLQTIVDSTLHPVLQSALSEALNQLDLSNSESRELYLKLLRRGDYGAVGSMSDHMSRMPRVPEVFVHVLESLRRQIELPSGIEIYNMLAMAQNEISGKDSIELMVLEFNNPIPWSILELHNDTVSAIVHTNKGAIELELYPLIAPGTVAEFIELSNSGFYNGKTFHRVIANFVAQGGCPRGDGWGSAAETLRSEFSALPYSAGSLGMASAGKDTESCQWFITHQSTPHLEGNYTLFGRVTSGMQVVNQIQVADAIESIEILH